MVVLSVNQKKTFLNTEENFSSAGVAVEVVLLKADGNRLPIKCQFLLLG